MNGSRFFVRYVQPVTYALGLLTAIDWFFSSDPISLWITIFVLTFYWGDRFLSELMQTTNWANAVKFGAMLVIDVILITACFHGMNIHFSILVLWMLALTFIFSNLHRYGVAIVKGDVPFYSLLTVLFTLVLVPLSANAVAKSNYGFGVTCALLVLYGDVYSDVLLSYWRRICAMACSNIPDVP